MNGPRRSFLQGMLTAAAASLGRSQSKAETRKLGIPGPYPGRVVEVDHPGCIVNGLYQREPVQNMIRRGMRELTGAPDWQEAWRSLFEKGDVVGIKVSPVGGPHLCSDALVMASILEGLQAAGVPLHEVIVFNRYRREA